MTGRTTGITTGRGVLTSVDVEPVASWSDGPMVVPEVGRSVRVAMVLTLLAAGAYTVFVLDPARRGDLGPWLALVVSEVLLLLNVAAIWSTSLSSSRRGERPEVEAYRAALIAGRSCPSIDVLVTAYGEPLDVLERTITAARDMRLEHRTYVCDDGRSDDLRALCERLGVGYLRRPDRDGVKAGNVNRALARTDGELVALFDADHQPHRDFLLLTVPSMARPELAFVQCPQAYEVDPPGFVERGSAEGQRVFYELVCPGKNRFDAAFHVGTNALFRRAALADVGGLFEDTHSEDIWTSIRLHQRGWSSTYLPHVVARGLSPATVDAFFRQQFRWASGSFEILLRSNPLTAPGLTLDQRMQYLTPPLHFLTAFANLTYLLLPPLFLLLGVTPLDAGSVSWLLAYLPFLVLTQAVLWLQTGGLRVRAVVLSVAVAVVHVQAFFAVLLRRSAEWRSTNADARVPPAVRVTLPQILVVVLNVVAVVVGLSAVENLTATAISVGLCALNSAILGRVIWQAVLDRRLATDVGGPA